MNTVELRQAFEWTCDECGRDNFESAMIAELTPEEEEMMKVKLLQDEDDDNDITELHGEFISAPETVECPHCGTEFRAECPWGEEYSQDEFDELFGR